MKDRREYHRQWRLSHRNEIREYFRKWKKENREHVISYSLNNMLVINGKATLVRKRPFNGICELCGLEIKSRPHWHHWDDKHPEQGMWVHNSRCHRLCEAVDDDPDYEQMKIYKEFRKKVESKNQSKKVEK